MDAIEGGLLGDEGELMVNEEEPDVVEDTDGSAAVRRIVWGHCCRVLAKNGLVTPMMTGGGPSCGRR